MDCRTSFSKVRIVQNVRTGHAMVREDVTRKSLTLYICASFLIEDDHTFYFEQCSTILCCACSIASPPPPMQFCPIFSDSCSVLQLTPHSYIVMLPILRFLLCLHFRINLFIFKFYLSVGTSSLLNNIKDLIFFLTRNSVRLNYESVIAVSGNNNSLS
jgi:hypothetical protein